MKTVLMIASLILCGLFLGVNESAAQKSGEIDISTIPSEPALDLVEAKAVDAMKMIVLLRRIGGDLDVEYFHRLDALAEAYSKVDSLREVSFWALHAIWRLSPPDSYFMSKMKNYQENKWLAVFAIDILGRNPSVSELEKLKAVLAESKDMDILSALNRYGHTLFMINEFLPSIDMDRRLLFLFRQSCAGLTPSGYVEKNNPYTVLSSLTVWSRLQVLEASERSTKMYERFLDKFDSKISDGQGGMKEIWAKCKPQCTNDLNRLDARDFLDRVAQRDKYLLSYSDR